jgi:hypothetical protein
MLVTVINTGGITDDVDVSAAQTTGVEQYFYDQLKSDAKQIYDAMDQMYTTGIFKTGTGDYDLGNNGYASQKQIQAYTEGDSRLLYAMGEARDAFRTDHPEIFYVDFDYLTLRVSKDKAGKYHAYLGTGRSDNYFTEGFSSESEVDAAIKEQESAVAKIAATAKKEETVAKQIKSVHDSIINTTSYRMEGVCDKGNEGVIRTSYGSLVKGQAVCEGYARAMKVVLDEMNIPCLLVQGIVRSGENTPQAHMWNYVKVDGEWFGVDATWDDPVDPTGKTDTQGVDGYETSEYLLASEPMMNKCHVPSGIMSSVEYEFTYPDLSIEELGFNTVVADRGLTVKYKKDGQYNDLEAGEFKVSYNGMGYKEAAKQGKYILGKFYQYDSETGEYDNGGWGYLNPDGYGESTMLEDSDTEITLRLPHIQFVEFAVTDIAPYTCTNPSNIEEANKSMTYQGDPLLFEAESGKLQNENGNYVAPPYIDSITPTTSGRLKIGSTYPVTVTYDDDLVQVDGEEVSFEVKSDGTTAVDKCKIENFKWDGKRTFTFDFTPSEYFADDTVLYTIQMTGVVGKSSKKLPNSINYIASHGCVAFAYRSQGYDWNVFGKPTLLENVDFDTTDWETNDGSVISDDIKSRLVLVTTKTTQAQEETMNDMIEENGDKILSSETYNINLTMCKSQIVKAGDGIRVSLGFPEGYSADDAGVTFKAYHFNKNEQGEITGVEPIDCVVTQYGLIITCKSFSPFAVAAVEDDGSNEAKTVILSNTEGGTITGADSDIFTLQEGESKTLTIQANDGYQIEKISVADESKEISDSSKETITIGYDDISGKTAIVDVRFLLKSIALKEEERNQAVDLPATTEEPTTTTTEKPTATTTEKPAATTEKPAATTEKPAATTEKPAATTEKPAATTEKPAVTTEKPAATTEKPAATTATKKPATVKKPNGTTITKLKKAKKAFTVQWKKQTKQTSGYQIRYATKKSMTGAKKVTIARNKTVSKKITKLKKKKTYYVQIRTYRKVGKKTYYSSWSKMKSVKTK